MGTTHDDFLSVEIDRLEREHGIFRAPVIEYFRHRSFHTRAVFAEWDEERMLRELKAQVYRSEVVLEGLGETSIPRSTRVVLFRFEPDVFGVLERSSLFVYAGDAERAEDLATRLRDEFTRPTPPTVPGFHLLSTQHGHVSTQHVPVGVTEPMEPASLALHYGEDMIEFEKSFTKALEKGVRGVSIFRGEPGTGKTTYIRHLMARFRESHRFYYLPIHAHLSLGAPSMVDFWTGELKAHPGANRVVVLEDAEESLMNRGPGNKEQVSTLLNVADGLLGEMLRVHLICTVNCPMERLDPAIIRPGRLVASREFRRMNSADARRLAETRRLHLPPQADYSLAEIYATAPLGSPVPAPPAILGFAPPETTPKGPRGPVTS
ncbi:MAG: AAA family ATPase [Verrucomicrobiae bacterium]|nr:AAA family ATPase [Verrucomicrobiae bacterium]